MKYLTRIASANVVRFGDHRALFAKVVRSTIVDVSMIDLSACIGYVFMCAWSMVHIIDLPLEPCKIILPLYKIYSLSLVK